MFSVAMLLTYIGLYIAIGVGTLIVLKEILTHMLRSTTTASKLAEKNKYYKIDNSEISWVLRGIAWDIKNVICSKSYYGLFKLAYIIVLIIYILTFIVMLPFYITIELFTFIKGKLLG